MGYPHIVQEDPEDHIGEEVPDPWDDPSRPDWPAVEVNEDGSVGPTLGEPEESA
jgi:hypothetical protein